jgi:hypothetical protein
MSVGDRQHLFEDTRMTWMLLLAAAPPAEVWRQLPALTDAGVAGDADQPERWSHTGKVSWKAGLTGFGWSSAARVGPGVRDVGHPVGPPDQGERPMRCLLAQRLRNAASEPAW